MEESQGPELAAARDLGVLPEVVSVDLSIKFGEPFMHSRIMHGSVVHLQIIVSGGYTVFHAHVQSTIERMPEIVWPSDSLILVKPTQNAPQSKYEEVYQGDAAFTAQLARLWNRAARRRHGYGKNIAISTGSKLKCIGFLLFAFVL